MGELVEIASLLLTARKGKHSYILTVSVFENRIILNLNFHNWFNNTRTFQKHKEDVSGNLSRNV